mmetsp:Transcript_25427/g.60603  ORF Transcript_25427/g.60603 Transcript_25427/m.60603 type:complete len:80 (-) Transcript_25427:415-654(-)
MTVKMVKITLKEAKRYVDVYKFGAVSWHDWLMRAQCKPTQCHEKTKMVVSQWYILTRAGGISMLASGAWYLQTVLMTCL